MSGEGPVKPAEKGAAALDRGLVHACGPVVRELAGVRVRRCETAGGSVLQDGRQAAPPSGARRRGLRRNGFADR